MSYECMWCGQTLGKRMSCAAVGPVKCFWVPLVHDVGVREAIRQMRNRFPKDALAYERPTSTVEGDA